jgi:hypothetical protein
VDQLWLMWSRFYFAPRGPRGRGLMGSRGQVQIACAPADRRPGAAPRPPALFEASSGASPQFLSPSRTHGRGVEGVGRLPSAPSDAGFLSPPRAAARHSQILIRTQRRHGPRHRPPRPRGTRRAAPRAPRGTPRRRRRRRRGGPRPPAAARPRHAAPRARRAAAARAARVGRRARRRGRGRGRAAGAPAAPGRMCVRARALGAAGWAGRGQSPLGPRPPLFGPCARKPRTPRPAARRHRRPSPHSPTPPIQARRGRSSSPTAARRHPTSASCWTRCRPSPRSR